MVTEHCQGSIAEPPLTSNDLPWYGGVLLCWLVCWLVRCLLAATFMLAEALVCGVQPCLWAQHRAACCIVTWPQLIAAPCRPHADCCSSRGTGMLPCDAASAYRQFCAMRLEYTAVHMQGTAEAGRRPCIDLHSLSTDGLSKACAGCRGGVTQP